MIYDRIVPFGNETRRTAVTLCQGHPHPYELAKDKFMAGIITHMEAVGLMIRDADWITECELNGDDPVETAQKVVEQNWLPKLVERSKRGA